LDPEQQKAVKAPVGPVRIIAGAGTGKTRTLIHRIAYWDANGDVPAEKTLSVTHSNKSAAELRRRLKELGVNKINAQTFHAAAKKQLEEYWEELSIYWQDKGYKNEFPRLISNSPTNRSENQYWIIRGIAQSVIKQADLMSKVKRIFDSELNQALNTELILLRARMIPINEYERNPSGKEKIGTLTKEEFVNFYRKYSKAKKTNNQIDFADLLELCILMLKDNPEIAAKIHSKYEHFLVDEFQDNDPVQDELLSQWLGKRNSICVVGDPRQTIYSFKGSEPSLLNNFGTRFPKCVTVELVRNYRSSPQIVAWANRLMHQQAAAGGAKSNLISSQPQGPQPIIMSVDSESAEHKLVAEKIQALIANTKTPNSQIAILLRINSSIPIFRQSLKKLGIATKSPDDTFWEDVLPIIKELQTNTDKSSNANGIEVLNKILEIQGWKLDFVEGEKFDPQKQQRLDNAEALIALAETLSSEEILTPLSLAKCFTKMWDDSKDDHDHNAVTVTTIHKAKGMEWDAILIPKFTDGVIPISFAKLPAEIDEERRLAYVAITRARKYLLISWSSNYKNSFGSIKEQSRSRFLSDMEEPELSNQTINNKLDANVYRPPSKSLSRYRLGDRVHTSGFGLGRVINIQGDFILVDFGSFGKKKFKNYDSSIERI
jgi:DNA helicase-2/ATP-dependent DNA helicase PcrA